MPLLQSYSYRFYYNTTILSKAHHHAADMATDVMSNEHQRSVPSNECTGYYCQVSLLDAADAARCWLLMLLMMLLPLRRFRHYACLIAFAIGRHCCVLSRRAMMPP